MLIKLRAPLGCGAVSHGNDVIEIDARGYVLVDEHIARVLIAHGFTSTDENAAGQKRGLVEGSPSGEPRPDAPEVDVERLNRPALFAFLKEKGVRVSLPITNNELRAIARAALKGCIREPLMDVNKKELKANGLFIRFDTIG